VPGTDTYDNRDDVQGPQVGTSLPEWHRGQPQLLTLVGESQELRLVFWDSKWRINRVLHFPHKMNTWYRMKLSCASGTASAW